MARKSTAIVVFLVLLNSSAVVMDASGLNDAMGVEPDPGASDRMEDAYQDARRGFEGNAGLGQTLFSMFSAVANFVRGLFGATIAAPKMFANLGAPTWLTGAIFVPLYIISALDLAYAFTGREMS